MNLPPPPDLLWTAVIEDIYGEREEFRFGSTEGTGAYSAFVAAQTIVRIGWEEGTKVVLVKSEEIRNLKHWGKQ